MKFLNILSIVIILAFIQACNPLKDDINALEIPTTVAADIDITLTDDDYDFVDKGFGNFDNEDEAKTLIPEILTENYPQFGAGSSAVVHYDLYNPIRLNNEVDFELTAQDYIDLGQTFGTLSNEGDIIEAVEFKHPDAEDNDVVTLTYEWYCGGCPDQGTRVSKVTYYEGKWYVAYVPTAEDYTFMGQNYPNFDSRTTARERIAKILGLKYLFDDAGTIRTSVFDYYNGSGVVDFMAVFQFDGEVWQPFQDVVQRTLQLGHDGKGWVPDNTIKYTLTGDDYTAIAAATVSSNSAGSSNLSTYGNFGLSLWSYDQIYDAIGNRLLEIFPQVEGQKYLVSYDTYPEGGKTVHLIFESGVYVQVE
jgi:hypothetical protein